MAGALNNPLFDFELITAPLVNGTYKFKVVSADNLGNENDGTEVSGAITQKLWYPTAFTISSVVGNVVTFTWAAPSGGRTPDEYIIYGNDGSGYELNRVTPLATVASGTWSKAVTVGNGAWLFVIESKDGSGETENNYSISQTVPLANVSPLNVNDPGDQPIYPMETNYPTTQLKNVQLRNVSVGKCEISFLLMNANNVSYFRVYHDSGTGTVDWGTYAYRFAKLDGFMQTFTTDRLFTTEEEKTYKFGIRAESADAVVEGNLIEYDVIIDGKAPIEIQNPTAGAV